MMKVLQFCLLWCILHLGGGDNFCTSTDVCSPDKPFCTSLGCVFECPKSAYINGTRCVVDCGDWFVLNGTCVSLCPNETFTRETPKFIGREIYFEKHCVDSCTDQEFLFKSTCVHACPLTHRHISGQTCVQQCPENALFLTNVTIKEMTFYKCESQCAHLVENSYCTDQCSANLTSYNQTCVSFCPKHYEFISKRTCVSECPANTVYIKDNICRSQCPVTEQYLYNGSCVNHCPPSFNIEIEDNVWNCVQNCSDGKLVFNQTCVLTCPNSYVIDGKTCASNCSDLRPLSCEGGSRCRPAFDFIFLWRIPVKNYTVCVDRCPDNVYALNSSCVDACPIGHKYLNASCVRNCPDDFPYMYNDTDGRRCDRFSCEDIMQTKCMKKCPQDTYKYNKMCYNVCPVGLYVSLGTCMENCDTPLTRNKTISYRTVVKTTYGWDTRIIKTDIVECVVQCGPEYVKFNTTCTKECPSEFKYITNGTCHEAECSTKYMQNESLYVKCSDVCEESRFIHGKQCLKNCPDHAFVYNQTCVSVCPDKSPIVKDAVKCNEVHCARFRNCTESCAENMYVLNRTCVSSCPKHTFVYDNTCMSLCPDNSHSKFNPLSGLKPSDYGNQCFNKCPKGTYIFNQTCLTKCQKGTYLLNNDSCVINCPVEQPLAFKGDIYFDTWKCISSCEGDLVFENGSCEYSCTDPAVAFEGVCIKRCPAGYIWLDECIDIVNSILPVPLVFIGIDILIFIIGRRILKEYFTVVWMSLSCCVRNREVSTEVGCTLPDDRNTVHDDVEANNAEMQIIVDDHLNLLPMEGEAEDM